MPRSVRLHEIQHAATDGELIRLAYLVESLPDVHYDIGELYGGLVPIDTNNASRALFFMFEPTVGEPRDEVTIW